MPSTLSRSRRFFLVALLCAALLPQRAVVSAPPPDAPPFAALRDQWASSLHEKRIDDAIALYTDDADFLQPDGSLVHGSAALRALYQTVTTQFDSNLQFASRKTEVSGNLAYDSGSYTETLLVHATGSQLNLSGNYLTVYRRDPSGHWRIAAQSWSVLAPTSATPH